MPRHIPTWPYRNAESKRKIAVISAAFLSIRSTEAWGIFGQTSAPSFTLVLEPWNFSLLYLLLIVSIIMFQGSIFYITQGCYSSCRRTSPKFCVSLSFVSHVKRACASSAPILLRSLVCDLLLLQSLEWELACRISLLPQGIVDDKGFVFSLRLTSYTSVTK